MYRVGQPSAALSRCGCCIPLAGEGGVRDCARRSVSERNRRKAALSAEITQEGIHRRLKPNSESCVSDVWKPSPKQARLIRHRRRFAGFPAPLKSNIFRTFTSSENKGNGEKRFFRPVAPPVFGGKAHGNRLGRRWKAKRRRGAKRLFRHVEAAIADGHGPFCGGCFFCGAAWALSLRENGFSPGFVKFLPKFKKVLALYTGVRCMILSRKRGRIRKECWPGPVR